MKLDRENILLIIRENLEKIKENFGVSQIAVFGSAANDKITEKSDIDLFVEFGKPVGFKFNQLVSFLEEITGKKVDVITPEGLNNIPVKEIAEDIRRNLLYV